jgi:hypothetical protein
MNQKQAIALGLAAANIILIMLFPPFDIYSIAKSPLPVFGGFSFYPQRTEFMVVNQSLLFLELFVALMNACMALLLLREKKVRVVRPAISRQNRTLLLVAINLVAVLLFPPFESVYALLKAATPTFEGFYFVFARQEHHVLVSAVLYLEVCLILINGAIFWLIFRDRSNTVPTP